MVQVGQTFGEVKQVVRIPDFIENQTTGGSAASGSNSPSSFTASAPMSTNVYPLKSPNNEFWPLLIKKRLGDTHINFSDSPFDQTGPKGALLGQKACMKS